MAAIGDWGILFWEPCPKPKRLVFFLVKHSPFNPKNVTVGQLGVSFCRDPTSNNGFGCAFGFP